MSGSEAEHRSASDRLITKLDRLSALEAEKRAIRSDDPRLLEMANEVERLAAEVLRDASIQTDLAEAAHGAALTDDPDGPSAAIEGSHRSPYDILEEWRAAERALTRAPPGSPEAAAALTRARGLRAEYQRAYQDVRREGATD